MRIVSDPFATLSLVLCVMLMALATPTALAQPSPAEDTEEVEEEDAQEEEATPASGDDADDDADDEESEEEGEDPQLRAPTLEMPDVDLPPEEGTAPIAEAPEKEDAEKVAAPEETEEDPGEDSASILEGAAPSSDPTEPAWQAPKTMFSLHGYFRVRGELQNSFSLGRTDGPFGFFRSASDGVVPMGGCGDEPTTGPDAEACESSALRFANMRLRLRPTLTLSDDVRVHMMIDVFDNFVLGSTPNSLSYVPPTFRRDSRSPGVPIDSFANSQNPPQALRNSLNDSIYVRRAWAEVTNRGLGQLRFGRMGSHWGLGMIANAGDGIDSDFSTDVDRVMVLTKLAGFFLIAAWDFASQGLLKAPANDLQGITLDATADDDVRQGVFAVARRTEPEEQAERLAAGKWVLNGGFYFVYRRHFLSSAAVQTPFPTINDSQFTRRDAQAFIPDLWGQFLWGDLRLEIELAGIFGTIQNITPGGFARDDYKIRQFGFAFEGEYRLLDGKLAISLHTGLATGDADLDGLSSREGLLAQQTGDRTLSFFQFHPNYRIDLILFRNILGQVGGAWYFKPGVSYDLIRNSFGQRLGGRVDFIYSRASKETQTYGSDPNLGLEIDLSLYYRTEDGPDLKDGFFVQAQFGILFPLAGLGYLTRRGVDQISPSNPSLDRAYTLRLILGVEY